MGAIQSQLDSSLRLIPTPPELRTVTVPGFLCLEEPNPAAIPATPGPGQPMRRCDRSLPNETNSASRSTAQMNIHSKDDALICGDALRAALSNARESCIGWAQSYLNLARDHGASNEEGRVVCRVTGIGALWVDDAFWFETGVPTDQGKNLARDPRCSLSVATHEFYLVAGRRGPPGDRC